MPGKALILGGYGNFGKRIAAALTKSGVSVIIAGRNEEKAWELVTELPEGLAETACFDAFSELPDKLAAWEPAVVVNTCGPFQTSDYSIAQTCIKSGVHYVDLADGREFVTGITTLDTTAREAGVAVISGASTVPGLSSAVLDHYRDDFAEMHSLRFGISPGQGAERGLATTKGILTYVGRPLKPFPGGDKAYGWQDIYRQTYPMLGPRWMANCDVPDLDLLPEHYGLKSIRFSAGLELGLLHLGLWGLSWLVRLGLPLNLPRYAESLLTASNWFNTLGSPDGGMHMIMEGVDKAGQPLTRKWFIVALHGDGPQIPTVPAIILARKLAKGELPLTGAVPCVGLVTLEDYLDELKNFKIQTYETE